MKVLVTGGSGFLGSHVVEQLVNAGHAVRALVRKSSNRKFLESLSSGGRVEFAEGSVEDAAKVADAVKGVDAIVHSAGVVKAKSADDFFATNTRGTKNLIDAAKQHAPGLKRFVYVSSLEACGPSPDGKPVRADAEAPITAYGRSKLAAEKEVLSAKDTLPVTILRPGAIYGPRDVEIFQAFVAARRRQYPVIGDGAMMGSWIFGPDCAKACIRAIVADVPSGRIYFVDDGEPLSMREAMGVHLPRAVGREPLFRFGVPFPLLRVASIGVEAYGRVRNKAVMLTRDKVNMLRHHWVCDSAVTQTELDWKPELRFTEGASVTARWYETNGWF